MKERLVSIFKCEQCRNRYWRTDGDVSNGRNYCSKLGRSLTEKEFGSSIPDECPLPELIKCENNGRSN